MAPKGMLLVCRTCSVFAYRGPLQACERVNPVTAGRRRRCRARTARRRLPFLPTPLAPVYEWANLGLQGAGGTGGRAQRGNGACCFYPRSFTPVYERANPVAAGRLRRWRARSVRRRPPFWVRWATRTPAATQRCGRCCSRSAARSPAPGRLWMRARPCCRACCRCCGVPLCVSCSSCLPDDWASTAHAMPEGVGLRCKPANEQGAEEQCVIAG